MNDPAVFITAAALAVVFIFFMGVIREFYVDRTAKNLSRVLWLGFCFVNVFVIHIMVFIKSYLMGG